MCAKKLINQGNNSTSGNSPALDFDPITNEKLSCDIWRALKSKIGQQKAM
jgi:hypothetical protein